jgi:hypothetical protein
LRNHNAKRERDDRNRQPADAYGGQPDDDAHHRGGERGEQRRNGEGHMPTRGERSEHEAGHTGEGELGE